MSVFENLVRCFVYYAPQRCCAPVADVAPQRWRVSPLALSRAVAIIRSYALGLGGCAVGAGPVASRRHKLERRLHEHCSLAVLALSMSHVSGTQLRLQH